MLHVALCLPLQSLPVMHSANAGVACTIPADALADRMVGSGLEASLEACVYTVWHQLVGQAYLAVV